MADIGTPLQAIKFSLQLANGMGPIFLKAWLDNASNLALWAIPMPDAKHAPLPFAKFCEQNPD